MERLISIRITCLLEQLLIGPANIWSKRQESPDAFAHALSRVTLELPLREFCRGMKYCANAADGPAPATTSVFIVHTKLLKVYICIVMTRAQSRAWVLRGIEYFPALLSETNSSIHKASFADNKQELVGQAKDVRKLVFGRALLAWRFCR